MTYVIDRALLRLAGEVLAAGSGHVTLADDPVVVVATGVTVMAIPYFVRV